MTQNGNKYVIITSCSKAKAKSAQKALNLYQGQFYLKVKKFAEKNGINLKVLSAKYGLVSEEFIEPYNQIISSKEDIKRLQDSEKDKIQDLISQYDKIILLMGAKYSKVFENYSDSKIMKAVDHRGSGGFLQMISRLYDLNTDQISKLFDQTKPTFDIYDIESLLN